VTKLLNYRIAFITVLFAAFGGILSTIMNIASVGSWSYAAIASLIAVVTSLFISLLLKREWTDKVRLRVQRISTGLFIAFIICCLAFIWLVRFGLTFEMQEFDNDKTLANPTGKVAYKTIRYVKGVSYTADAQQYIRENPGAGDNTTELVQAFGGSAEMNAIWSEDSRDLAQFYLMFGYCLFVLLFVANVSLLCEVLVTKYKS
jgi:hypothetical protein